MEAGGTDTKKTRGGGMREKEREWDEDTQPLSPSV